ncbi:AI-2E family transporter [Bacillus lacus]|uniref:AI-2E family transporter n=1 Tax=Metabacillus lacus TaxID=1983721 RepID=A0A7X2IXN7_9BACI|nr:AI-2E family transporter [Metabacillus lacus]MRX71367.1 AI-2E family transporter [Metabacillus lacus]
MNDKYIKLLLKFFIVLLGLLCIYMFLNLKIIWNPFWIMVKAVFLPFIISALITYLLHPIVEKLHETGMPRSLSIFIIYVLFFGSAGYGFYRGIPVLIDQLIELSENIPALASSYNKWLLFVHHQTDRWPDGLHDRIDMAFIRAENWVAGGAERLIASLRSVLDYILVLAIIPFLVFYMLKDFSQMKKAAWYLTPKSWRRKLIPFVKDADKSLGDYFRGQLFVCVIIGTLASLSFWFTGVRYPLILGLLIGITNIIPYFGPVIGAVPAVIIAATASGKTVIVVLLIIAALQFIEGNILGPLIVGKSLHLHPVVIMLGLLAGGEIAGIPGLIAAVPVIAVLRVVAVHLPLLRQH